MLKEAIASLKTENPRIKVYRLDEAWVTQGPQGPRQGKARAAEHEWSQGPKLKGYAVEVNKDGRVVRLQTQPTEDAAKQQARTLKLSSAKIVPVYEADDQRVRALADADKLREKAKKFKALGNKASADGDEDIADKYFNDAEKADAMAAKLEQKWQVTEGVKHTPALEAAAMRAAVSVIADTKAFLTSMWNDPKSGVKKEYKTKEEFIKDALPDHIDAATAEFTKMFRQEVTKEIHE